MTLNTPDFVYAVCLLLCHCIHQDHSDRAMHMISAQTYTCKIRMSMNNNTLCTLPFVGTDREQLFLEHWDNYCQMPFLKPPKDLWIHWQLKPNEARVIFPDCGECFMIDSVKVLCPIQYKMGHFGDFLLSQSLGTVLKK